MVFLASLSIGVKFSLVANAARYLKLSETPNYSMLIDFVLLLTIFSVVGYFLFIRDVINLMQPETIAKQILTKLDLNWMEDIRSNWSDRRRRLAFSDDDPMILFERYLATTIERGDIYSTKNALIMMRDRISGIMNKDDGAIIDNYLFNRLENVIDILADKRSDLGLEIFAEVIDEITMPSLDVIKAAEVGIFDDPPGSQLLRKIAEKSIDFQLKNSGRRAIRFINDRGSSTVSALPAYNELWLINQQNQDLPKSEMEKLWKNDWRLDNYIEGYLSYFGNLGEEAVKKNQQNWFGAQHIQSHPKFL